MPNIKSAIKRVRTNNERNVKNAAVKSSMRTAIKKAGLHEDHCIDWNRSGTDRSKPSDSCGGNLEVLLQHGRMTRSFSL